MLPQEKKLLQESLRSIAAWHSEAVAQIQEKMDELIREFELDEASEEDREANGLPIANMSTFCVEWQGRTCFLGNTLLFWMFERLARSPNCYVAHVDLLDDVWRGMRESSTIRGVAKRLRDRLVAADMSDLAAAIDGGVFGYYGLMLV